MGSGAVADSPAHLDVLHPAIQPQGPAGGPRRDGGRGPQRLDHHGKHRRRSRGEVVRDRRAGDREISGQLRRLQKPRPDAHPHVRQFPAGHPLDRHGVASVLVSGGGDTDDPRQNRRGRPVHARRGDGDDPRPAPAGRDHQRAISKRDGFLAAALRGADGQAHGAGKAGRGRCRKARAPSPSKT